MSSRYSGGRAATEREVNAREILAKRPPKADEKVGGSAYAPMTPAQMLDAAEPEWLIEGVLVAGQGDTPLG